MQALQDGDIAEGARLIQEAAQAGLPMAQYRLSKLYERGQGVPRDLTQSRTWTERAANNGNVKAMHDLAVFFAEGEGGPQSYAGSVQWFRKAADYGLVDSQYNLGVLYEQGLGVTANPTEALYWFLVADKLGDTGAGAKAAEIAADLPQDAVAKATSLAERYQPKANDAAANGRFGSASSASTGPATQTSPAPSNQAAMTSEAQELLNQMGYNAGAPDGSFGAQTRQAILTYQSANNLPQSGAVTPTLIRQLKASVADL